MAFDLFNDVFLLYLALESPQGVFQGFTVLESYFRQTYDTSKPITELYVCWGPTIKIRLNPAKVLISYALDSKQAHKIFATPGKRQLAVLTRTEIQPCKTSAPAAG